jgi:DNA-binding MarR family transcriptional regulator
VTTAGRRRLGELRKRGETAEQELLASLTPSERRLLRDLLRKLAVGVTA